MINRINLILKAKNITAKQFAEEIGIQPSGMSHIMGGRNNPSLEFVSKVLRRYPELDANWLLLGRGEMYAAGTVPSLAPAPPSLPEPTLFSGGSDSMDSPVYVEEKPQKEEAPQPAAAELEPEAGLPTDVSHEERRSQAPKPAARNGARRAERIIIMYSDGTFVEYLPDGSATARQ